LFAPREVIKLFFGGAVHLFFDVRVPSDHRVTLVQGLRCDFTGMVHSHQAGGMSFLFFAEVSLGNIGSGVLAGGSPGRGRDRAKRVVGSGQNSIDRR
jgi:hypothetical protein